MRLTQNLIRFSLAPILASLAVSASTGAETTPTTNLQTLISTGEAAAAENDWKAAAQYFLEATKLQGQNKIAFYDLGIAYCHLGSLQQALEAEKKAIDLDEEYVPAYIQMATVLSKMHDSAGAEVALRKALQLQPESRLARENLDQLLAKGEPVNSAVDSSSTQSFDSNIVDLHNNRQETSQPPAVDRGGSESRQSTAETAPGWNETVPRSKFDRLSTNQPSKVAPSQSQSGAPVPEGGSSSATTKGAAKSELSPLSSAEDVLMNVPGAPEPIAPPTEHKEVTPSTATNNHAGNGPNAQQTTLDLVSEATIYFTSGAVDTARKTLLRALEADSNNAVAHANLGVIYGTQGEFAKQIEEERAAVQLEPRNAEPHLNLAWALARTHRYQESLKEYEQALSLNPTLSEAESGRAFVQGKLGHTSAAIKSLLEQKEKHATVAWPCIALSSLYLGQKQTDKATDELREALRRHPDDVEACKRLAQIELNRSDWDGAIDHYRTAQKTAPYDLDIYLGLGAALQKRGNTEEALKLFKSAVEIAPNNAAAHATLSITLEQLGRRTEAEKEARSALKLDPKQQLAQTVLKRISTQ